MASVWIMWTLTGSWRHLAGHGTTPHSREFPAASLYPNAIKAGDFSERGLLQASEVGKQLAKEMQMNRNETVHHVFTSPFTRCIQTSTQILLASGLHSTTTSQHSQMKLKVEPGFAESLNVTQWPTKGFLPVDQLVSQSYPVDTEYEPAVQWESLSAEETNFACAPRVQQTLERLLERYDGNLVVVSHGAPITAAHWALTGEMKYVGQCTVCKYQLVERPREGAVREMARDQDEYTIGEDDDSGLGISNQAEEKSLLDRMEVKCVKVNDSSHLSDQTNLRDVCLEIDMLKSAEK